MEGDARMAEPATGSGHDFYPRPHMEGDGKSLGFNIPKIDFYPRPHMEGDWIWRRMNNDRQNFYPRPHMEGDALEDEGFIVPGISTHALTWRATNQRQIN